MNKHDKGSQSPVIFILYFIKYSVNKYSDIFYHMVTFFAIFAKYRLDYCIQTSRATDAGLYTKRLEIKWEK